MAQVLTPPPSDSATLTGGAVSLGVDLVWPATMNLELDSQALDSNHMPFLGLKAQYAFSDRFALGVQTQLAGVNYEDRAFPDDSFGLIEVSALVPIARNYVTLSAGLGAARYSFSDHPYAPHYSFQFLVNDPFTGQIVDNFSVLMDMGFSGTLNSRSDKHSWSISTVSFGINLVWSPRPEFRLIAGPRWEFISWDVGSIQEGGSKAWGVMVGFEYTMLVAK